MSVQDEIKAAMEAAQKEEDERPNGFVATSGEWEYYRGHDMTVASIYQRHFNSLSRHAREFVAHRGGGHFGPCTVQEHGTGCRYKDQGPFASYINFGCPDC